MIIEIELNKENFNNLESRNKNYVPKPYDERWTQVSINDLFIFRHKEKFFHRIVDNVFIFSSYKNAHDILQPYILNLEDFFECVPIICFQVS